MDHSRPSVFRWVGRFAKRGILTFVVAYGVILLYTSVATPMYTSQARLFVQLGRESIGLDPTATTGQFISLNESRENEIKSIRQLLESRQVWRQVVDAIGAEAIVGKDRGLKSVIKKSFAPLEAVRLNPFKVYSLEDKAIKKMQKKLKFRLAKGSSVIIVSYEADSPKFAQRLLNEFIKQAQVEHLRVHRNLGSRDFFETQTTKLHKEVVSREASLRDFKTENGIADLGEQRSVLVERIGTLESRVGALSAQDFATRKEIAQREKALEEVEDLVILEEVEGQVNSGDGRHAGKTLRPGAARGSECRDLHREHATDAADSPRVGASSRSVGARGAKEHSDAGRQRSRATLGSCPAQQGGRRLWNIRGAFASYGTTRVG